MQEYADSKLQKNGYTKGNEQSIEAYVSGGKKSVLDAKNKKKVDVIFEDVQKKLDSVEYFNVKVIMSDLRHRNTTVQKNFLDENKTYGITLISDEWLSEHSPDEEVPEQYTYIDKESPQTRTHIITNFEQLQEVFVDIPQVNFEREMIVVSVFSLPRNHGVYTRKVIVDNDMITIYNDFKEIAPYKGTPQAPHQALIVYKMDKLDVTTAETVTSKKK